MSDAPLDERLEAVERALTDGDEAVPDQVVPDDLAARVETLEADVAELEAAVQAVRGYVGSVKHVNDEVEQRADAAMAKAEALERSLAAGADDDGPADHRTVSGGCPRCGAGRRPGGPVPGNWGPKSPPRPPDDAGTTGGENEWSADREDGGGPPGASGGDRLGHGRLEAEDEAEGLIERLKGVL